MKNVRSAYVLSKTLLKEFYLVLGIYYRLLRLQIYCACNGEKYKINLALFLGVKIPRNEADRSLFSSAALGVSLVPTVMQMVGSHVGEVRQSEVVEHEGRTFELLLYDSKK